MSDEVILGWLHLVTWITGAATIAVNTAAATSLYRGRRQRLRLRVLTIAVTTAVAIGGMAETLL